jgi:type IV pilus assembly protein PilZ
VSSGDDEGAASESPAERRSHERFDTSIQVDYASGDTFLYAYITNISEMGIFIRSESPAARGTALTLRFAAPGGAALEIPGVVAWVNPVRPGGENPNPGMGIRFLDLALETREHVVALVRTVAYLHDEVMPSLD